MLQDVYDSQVAARQEELEEEFATRGSQEVVTNPIPETTSTSAPVDDDLIDDDDL